MKCMALGPRTPGLLRDVPAPARAACVGALSAGAVGAIVGLVVGIEAYPPTAWFAVLELGVPAACAGGVVGLFAGLVPSLAGGTSRRIKQRRAPDE